MNATKFLAKGMEKPYPVDVNLQEQTVTGEDGVVYNFNIDPYYKEMLLNGWDEIALTFKYEDKISEYEAKRIAY